MKIMHLIGSKNPGGAEKFFLRMVDALNTENEQLFVVRKGSWVATRLKKMGYDVKELTFGGLFDFVTKKEVAKLAKEFEPDVIQGWMSRGSKFLPKTSIPTVARLGGYYPLKYYKNADHLVGNTEDICKYLVAEGRPEEQVSYLPNFPDMPPEDYRDFGSDVREEYGLKDDDFVVFMIGRLHEHEGYDYALYALKHLPENVHMVVAGSGPEEDNLKAMVEADDLTNRVHFAGWVNNMTPFCAAADIMAHPARIEPLGNSVLEAWAHKLPIVAAASVGPKKLISDGDTGLLFPVEDEKTFALQVKKLVDDKELRNKIAQQGYDYLQDNFSKQAVLDKYMALYNKIVVK